MILSIAATLISYGLQSFGASATSSKGVSESSRTQYEVLSKQRMSSFTVRLPGISSRHGSASEDVRSIGSKHQMTRINALPVVAVMVYSEIFWNWTGENHVSYAMRKLNSPRSRTCGDGHLSVLRNDVT